MPLGDSITQGNRHQNSYRRPLWHILEEAGLSVDFVGSQRRNHWGGPPDPDFDPDHEGHWGWRADQILTRLHKWTAAARPDIVLIHLGTNDLAHSKEPEVIADELSAAIQVLRTHNPRVAVLVAQLIDNAFISPLVQDLNEVIKGLAAGSTPESPIIIVDQWTGFDPRMHTYDGTHPNEAGERFMARRWAEALLPVLSNQRLEPSDPRE
ncbi:MAG TPA: cellulose-binding protein [Desulfonatronum sp.]|nr:cellulose-binding protein [Desulfonatronum sp.]